MTRINVVDVEEKNLKNARQTQEIAHDVILQLQRARRMELIMSGELPEFEEDFDDKTIIESRNLSMKELVSIPRKKIFKTFERFFR